jgi:TonB family protein
MKQAAISYGCLAVSVFVHGFAVFGNARPMQSPQRPPLTELELAPLAAPARPAPPPPPEPATKPRPVPTVRAPLKTLPVAEPEPSRAEPESPATPPEPELTGRTLTAAGDASWSAPAGNGADRGLTLGVGAVARQVMPAPAPRLATSTPVPGTRPLAELSRKPAPPSLVAALERNYPAAARRQGKSGEAKVRALIDARGRASAVTVTSESSPGFGTACQQTLLQSQWTPPLGPHGEPTGTFVSYRCRFKVSD